MRYIQNLPKLALNGQQVGLYWLLAAFDRFPLESLFLHIGHRESINPAPTSNFLYLNFPFLQLL